MREATTFSRILEMKMRFEIGRKLLRSSVDRDGFLRRGWTRACLNDDGKIPSERERLTRFVMIGPSSLKQSFKRKVGMESRWSKWLFWKTRWNEGGEIVWLLKLRNLECDSSYLETYSVMNRKPMQIRMNRRDAAKTRMLSNNPNWVYSEQAVGRAKFENKCASKRIVTIVHDCTIATAIILQASVWRGDRMWPRAWM